MKYGIYGLILSICLIANMLMVARMEGKLRTVSDQLELADNAINAFRSHFWIKECSDVGGALNMYDHRRFPEMPLRECSEAQKKASELAGCCMDARRTAFTCWDKSERVK